MFIVCIISLFLKNKALPGNKYNNFNFILKIIFLLWSIMLYIISFEIRIDILIRILVEDFLSFEEKVSRLTKDVLNFEFFTNIMFFKLY